MTYRVNYFWTGDGAPPLGRALQPKRDGRQICELEVDTKAAADAAVKTAETTDGMDLRFCEPTVRTYTKPKRRRK